MTPERPADFARALDARAAGHAAGGCTGPRASVFVSDQAQVDGLRRGLLLGLRRDRPRRRAAARPTRGPRRAARRAAGARAREPRRLRAAASAASSPAGRDGGDDDGAEVEVPLAHGQRRGAAGRQELRRARAARARAALPADVAPASSPPRCGARAATSGRATASGSTCGAPCAASLRTGGDPIRLARRRRRVVPPPARDAVRHLGLDGALRPRLPAVPDLRRRQRARTPRRSSSPPG